MHSSVLNRWLPSSHRSRGEVVVALSLLLAFLPLAHALAVFSYDPIPGILNAAAVVLTLLLWCGVLYRLHDRVGLGVRAETTSDTSLSVRAARLARRRSGVLSGLTAVTVTLAAAAAQFLVFRGFANSGDEYALLFSMWTLLEGRLSNPAPPVPEALQTVFTVVSDGRWFGMYAPGIPALFSLAELAGITHQLVNPLLCGLAALLLWHLARQQELPPIACLAVVLLACGNGFFLLTGASYMSHHIVLTGGLGFALAACHLRERPRAWIAVLAGASLGVVGISRHPEMIVLALPWLVSLAFRLDRSTLRTLAWTALGGAPFLIALLFYYNGVTGDPTLPPMLVRNPNDTLRFLAEEGDAHSFLWAGFATVVRMIQWAEWTAPAYLPVWAVSFLVLARARAMRFFDFYLPILVVMYLFYWGLGWNQYGPRYYHLALPFTALTILRAAVVIWPELSERWRQTVQVALAAMISSGIIYFAVWCGIVSEVVHQRQDPYRQVAAQGLDRAIVLLASGSGVVYPMEPEALIRNGITLEDDAVIYAMDLPYLYEALADAFPEHSFWRYTRARERESGRLVPVVVDRE